MSAPLVGLPYLSLVFLPLMPRALISDLSALSLWLTALRLIATR